MSRVSETVFSIESVSKRFENVLFEAANSQVQLEDSIATRILLP